MTKPQERQQALIDSLEHRVLVLDGAMGTMIHQAPLSIETDYLGRENCPEILNVTRPDVLLDIHRAYLQAGADIIETDTFGSTSIVLAEYGLADRAREISRRAAELARQAADEFATAAKPRFVAGSMGPTTKAISVTGGVTFDALRDAYYEQAAGLVEGGADILVLETCQDTRNVKAGLLAIEPPSRATSASTSRDGRRVHHRTHRHHARRPNRRRVLRFHRTRRLLSIGLNCATGPEFMTDHIRTLNEIAATRISCYPNAGLPDSDGHYRRNARVARRAARALRRSRLAQHRRRLLRHHARPHRAPSRRWPRASRRAPPEQPPHRALLFRHRTGGGRGEPTARCSSASAPTSSARASSKT